MSRTLQYGLLALWLTLASCLAWAQVAVPTLNARVTDLTATLDQQQLAALEQKLQAFEQAKGSQLAVLLLPTTGEESIEQYSIRVVEQWRLGRNKVDDGVLLLLAKNDHTLRIEVGYGLEGALNDATCKRIISEVIVPRLKQGDFYGGIDAGVTRIMAVINGEPLPPPAANVDDSSDEAWTFVPFAVVFATILGGALRQALGRWLGAAGSAAAVGSMLWYELGWGWQAALVAAGGFPPAVGVGPGGGGGGVGGGGGGGRWACPPVCAGRWPRAGRR
ncbi:TPM domain-containing protein [Vogesella oryzae]|uniref:TPM domain-containing protein n=1 Tax=Vogesella oryzae TaxID=1735285 RepID=UPI0015833B45|nr:TPM domain-containing protein [Vogesella oryzae]